VRITTILHYLLVFVLGALCAIAYFAVPLVRGPLPSVQAIWAVNVATAAALFAVLRLAGPVSFGMVVAYCVPVTSLTLLLAFGKGGSAYDLIPLAAEPIVIVWAGAMIVWMAFRMTGMRRGEQRK
jgi:hypothetical protein